MLAPMSTPKAVRKKKPDPGPLRSLLNLVWRQPLYAIPFGVFFGTINGGGHGWDAYVGSFLVSVIFAYAIGLAIWFVEYVVMPRIHPTSPADTGPTTVHHIAWYGGASVVGAFLAAIVVHFTLIPGFLGNARSVATLLMFTVIFTALFMGIFSSLAFYRRSIEHAKSEQELHLARRIQRSFLLSQFPEMPRLEVHAVNVSSKQVSGDFYDVVPAGENAFLIAIADVAGKGVPAALLSSMLQASLRTQAASQPSVAAILASINTLVYRSTAVHQFATFFLARVEENTMRLTFSNAGHNFPVLFRRDGTRRTLEKGGTVVGILESASFEEDAVVLEPGDRILLYTDGLNEAADASGELYGEERLCDRFAALPRELPARDLTERVLGGVREFLGDTEAGDDMTVMVLRVLEGAPAPAGAAGRAPETIAVGAARPSA